MKNIIPTVVMLTLLIGCSMYSFEERQAMRKEARKTDTYKLLKSIAKHEVEEKLSEDMGNEVKIIKEGDDIRIIVADDSKTSPTE